MKTFVTGHSGFVGRHLVHKLQSEGHTVVMSDKRLELQNLDLLAESFSACDVVFHCAGFAHADDDGSEEFAAQHWAVNFQGAVNVADAAVSARVKRLIFISTVKAVADAPDIIVDEQFDLPPSSPYGKAKRAAEEALKQRCTHNNLELVIVRPAMIYGRDGKGNLPRILHAIRKGFFPPLPNGGRRSLIHIDDVVNALMLVAIHPAAPGKIYILAHPVPVTTREIYLSLRQLLGLHAPVWVAPNIFLKIVALTGTVVGHLYGRPLPFNQNVYKKLMQQSVYSSEKISRELDWQSAVDLQSGLRTLQDI